jgi:extracellular factor (EF) 3-hydroxypalmitic acid methyl ester biosynthesis protein
MCRRDVSADEITMAGNRLQYLSSNDWTLIKAKSARRTYKLGEEIIQQGAKPDSIFIIRRGKASVELAGTNSTAIVAQLGPDDICGDIAFLERGRATAAVIAKDDEVEVDEIKSNELRDVFEAFPRLASRFYLSLAVILARRLKDTSRELARERAVRDRQ